MSIAEEKLLSAPDSRAGRLQRACLKLLREHNRRGEIPTNGRFVFYELEQAGVIPKKFGTNSKTGKAYKWTPAQDVSRALMHLRECGLVPWSWIEDETRTLDKWRYADTVADYLVDTVDRARIDLWDGEPPPLIICESRATKGVLGDLVYQYLVPITATNGQCGGFIVTDIVPLLQDRRKVLYVGDYELRGPADQIETNTKRYIEEHTGRTFGPDEWIKIALTDEQVKANPRLKQGGTAQNTGVLKMTKEIIIRPSFRRERAALKRGVWPIAGCDEAGRGSLAGPVVAAAVILDPDNITRGLDDSKRLTPERRAVLYERIMLRAQVAVAVAPPACIDRDNILRASLWAMARAVVALPEKPALVFVDGRDRINAGCDCQAVIDGDETIASIAAASIVAKVTRDRLMAGLGAEHTGYGFERHMGYGVPEHFDALNRLGPTIHHRRYAYLVGEKSDA
jgi:ribonuclease HII